MLIRVDMPGLQFDALELRFDSRTSKLSFRPDALDDLLAWNELQPELQPETASNSTALFYLLAACYAQWLAEGGWHNPAMEVALATANPVTLVRLAPRHPSLRQRAGLALQRWLGLAEVAPEIA